MADEKKEVDELLDEFFPAEEEPPEGDAPPEGEEKPTEEEEKPSEEEEKPAEEEEKPLEGDEKPAEGEKPPEGEEKPPEGDEELIPEEENIEEKAARLEAQNALLLERLEAGYKPPPAKEEPPEGKKPPGDKPEAKPSEPIDFVGDRSLEDVLDTKEGLNKFLNEVVKKVVPQGGVEVEPVVERILTALPKIVQAQVTQQTAINALVKDFYDNNEDLLVARRTVGVFTNEVAAEHPDWETKAVFEEAGNRTRKALGLRKKAVGDSRRKPAFVKQKGSRKGGEIDKRTDTAKEIDELID